MLRASPSTSAQGAHQQTTIDVNHKTHGSSLSLLKATSKGKAYLREEGESIAIENKINTALIV
jgi:hypothetical protein